MYIEYYIVLLCTTNIGSFSMFRVIRYRPQSSPFALQHLRWKPSIFPMTFGAFG